MKQAATWDVEQNYLTDGAGAICGIDEVGRGAWAGPIVAAVFMFFSIPQPLELYDSKLITEAKRQRLASELSDMGHAGIGEVNAEEIDAIGLQNAQYLAYERALLQLPKMPDLILLDGRPWKNAPIRHEAIVGGDRKVASIAAASIIAKVYRDGLMKSLYHSNFPQYGFNVHVGYGTAFHKQALVEHGVSRIHRQTYKPILALTK